MRILAGGANATAAIVPADNNVLYPQDFHSVLENGQTVQIGANYEIGDVSMDEHFPRSQSENFICWNAAVGATNPKKLRGLERRQPSKIIGVILYLTLCPVTVILKQFF